MLGQWCAHGSLRGARSTDAYAEHPGAPGRPASRFSEAMSGSGVEHFRAVRREIEAGVLPLATSIDGRRFTFQTSLHDLALALGGYVMIESEGVNAFGQVLSLELALREAGELQ